MYFPMKGSHESVHLTLFPDFTLFSADESLVFDMDLVRKICSSCLSIRKKHNIRARMPLLDLRIIGETKNRLQKYSDIIRDEVNVKNVIFEANIEEFASKTISIVFAKCGSRLGKAMGEVTKAVKSGKYEIMPDGKVNAAGEMLEKDEVEIGFTIKTGNGMFGSEKFDISQINGETVVMLNISITDDLLSEALARDFIRFIQNKRKEINLNLSDRISIKYWTSDDVIKGAILKYSDFISSQVLADLLTFSENTGEILELDCGSVMVMIGV